MERRQQLSQRIHFFEYYSLEKFEEALRDALNYSIDIITQSDRFVQFHQYSKVISATIEFLINLPYALKYNASYSEYFYGFQLTNKMNHFQRILVLLIRITLPRSLNKLQYFVNQQNGQTKTILLYILRIIKIIDLLLKLKYLLNEDHQIYSLFYLIIQKGLQRNKVESPYKHLMILVYLGLKLLDYYFSRQQKQVPKTNELIKPLKNIKPEQVQQFCPKCMKVPTNPAVLKSSGFVYCLNCLQLMVQQRQITNDHIIRIYQ